jgi:hypothetical protein
MGEKGGSESAAGRSISRMANRKDSVVMASSGNVFADLGLPNAEELNTKLRLCPFLGYVGEGAFGRTGRD